MKPGKYKCAYCDGVFKLQRDAEWSDEKAWEEHDKNFPGESHDTVARVCDDCYKRMTEIKPVPTTMNTSTRLIRLKFCRGAIPWWRFRLRRKVAVYFAAAEKEIEKEIVDRISNTIMWGDSMPASRVFDGLMKERI